MIGGYDTERCFEILIRHGKQIVQSGIGRADDHVEIRLLRILQLFIAPGIDRPCLFEVIGRGDKSFDLFSCMLGWFEVGSFFRRKEAVDLLFQFGAICFVPPPGERCAT